MSIIERWTHVARDDEGRYYFAFRDEILEKRPGAPAPLTLIAKLLIEDPSDRSAAATDADFLESIRAWIRAHREAGDPTEETLDGLLASILSAGQAQAGR